MAEIIEKSRKFPDDLVWGILVHLPIKYLLRFKKVEKKWFEIIEKSQFAKEHALEGAFRGLIITVHYKGRGIFNGNITDNCTKLCYNEELTWGEWEERRLVVNGSYGNTLVNGLIAAGNYNPVRLCNMSTQEIVTLSKHSKSEPEKNMTFHLGYDNVGDLNKIVKMQNDDAEIFSLGSDNSWCCIKDKIPSKLDEECPCLHYSICIKGTLYFEPWFLGIKPIDYEVEPKVETATILLLHLDTELYETLPLMLPRDVALRDTADINLAEIGGDLALFTTRLAFPGTRIEVHRVGKDVNGKFERWITHICQLPVYDPFSWAGTLPSGEMLVIRRDNNPTFPIPLFKFDHNTNTLDSIETCEPLPLPEEETELCHPLGLRDFCISNHQETVLALGRLEGVALLLQR